MDAKDLPDCLTAAKRLLGCTLHHDTPDGTVSGIIVETEAYHQTDPASHTFRGRTARNAPMFEAAGTIYIYKIYGMHHCLNVVAGREGIGEGVLIRALEPVDGLDIMRRNRGIERDEDLTNGPGKLVQALGIDPGLSGRRYGEGPLSLTAGLPLHEDDIVVSRRIGISRGIEELARFYIRGNRFVSRK
jgi:DNA-3-methyladenine glycosylase